MGVRVKEKGDEQDGWEPFGWGSLRFVSFHWQHVIIPRPGAEGNQLQTALVRFSHRSGYPIPDQPRIPHSEGPVNYEVVQCAQLGK